jgi:hypothetical protein
MLFFEEETPAAQLTGPMDSFLSEPKPILINFQVHRNIQSRAAVIEIQDQTFVLKRGKWTPWLQLNFPLLLPAPLLSAGGGSKFPPVCDSDQHRSVRSGGSVYRTGRTGGVAFRGAGAFLYDRLSGRPQGTCQQRVQRRGLCPAGKDCFG